MTARELRAEARAWRASARLTDAWRGVKEGYGPPTTLLRRRDALAGLAPRMWARWLAGRRGSTCRSLTNELFEEVLGSNASLANDREASVWFCLILALECEDEAAELDRGGR